MKNLISIPLFLSVILLMPVNVFSQGLFIPQKDNASANYSYSDSGLNLQRTHYSAFANTMNVHGYNLFLSEEYGEIHSDTQGYFPDRLYQAGLKAELVNKDSSVSMFVESLSDDLFYSSDESDFGFTYAKDWIAQGKGTWIFTLNYSYRRTFWRGIPIPFLSYRYVSRELVLYAPFFGMWNINDKFSLSAMWQPVKFYNLDLNWKAGKNISLHLMNGISLEQFLIAKRPDKKHSLYLVNNSLSLKPVWSINDKAELSCLLGYNFGGEYYTGKSYSDKNNKTTFSKGFMYGMSVKYGF